MDMRLFFTTFATVFLAELGDKTQLTALTLSAGNASRWSVFVAASMALVLSTAIAVLGGEYLMQYVPLAWVRRAAGALFVVLGTVTLWQSR